MSINTTVKVGFDGTAVKSGLKNIGGMFGKFSKEVGIGATRKVGELGTDLLGKTLSFSLRAWYKPALSFSRKSLLNQNMAVGFSIITLNGLIMMQP